VEYFDTSNQPSILSENALVLILQASINKRHEECICD